MSHPNVVMLPLTLALFLTAASPASPMEPLRAHKRDALFTHPNLDSLRPHTIALLPAVAFADDPEAMAYLEKAMVLLYSETGHDWRPASAARVRMALASSKPDSLYDAMAKQVRRTGHVEPATGAALAQLLEVESTMTLRIDRWEVVSDRAMVELTGALVDSSGRLLWQISGLSGYGDMDPWTVQGHGKRLAKATYNLFARWYPAVPSPGEPRTEPQAEPTERTVATQMR